MKTVYCFGEPIEITDIEYGAMLVLSMELKEKRMQCRRCCATYNTEDRDCEVYGSQHPSPSQCGYYLLGEILKTVKFTEKQLHEVQHVLGIYFAMSKTFIDDAEAIGNIELAKKLSDQELHANEISKKLFDGNTTLSKGEINLIIEVLEQQITEISIQRNITESQRKEILEEETSILKLLHAAYN